MKDKLAKVFYVLLGAIIVAIIIAVGLVLSYYLAVFSIGLVVIGTLLFILSYLFPNVARKITKHLKPNKVESEILDFLNAAEEAEARTSVKH